MNHADPPYRNGIKDLTTDSAECVHRPLPDGRILTITTATFGKTRLHVSRDGYLFDDTW